MNTPNDGGPIAASLFQSIPMGDGISQVKHLESVGGLSIRDWFAGHSTPPDNMTIPDLESLTGEKFPEGKEEQVAALFKARAMFRIKDADAMLAARDRKESA